MEQKNVGPLVSAETNMRELSLKAVLLGVVMAACMGAANAYLGLKAGMTIAATYTTAVVGMAVIKALKGTLLEENCARTVGSIGGNIATGAIFTLPAFFIAGIWQPFSTLAHGLVSTLMLVAGGILGIMFVTVTRRVLVEQSGPALPGVAGRCRDPQGRAARHRRRVAAAVRDGRRRLLRGPHGAQGHRREVAGGSACGHEGPCSCAGRR